MFPIVKTYTTTAREPSIYSVPFCLSNKEVYCINLFSQSSKWCLSLVRVVLITEQIRLRSSLDLYIKLTLYSYTINTVSVQPLCPIHNFTWWTFFISTWSKYKTRRSVRKSMIPFWSVIIVGCRGVVQLGVPYPW